MKYKLPIRKINESDIGADCPFMPEDDDFDMYLDALKEDIQNLDVVISLIQEDRNLIFEIESELAFPLLHSSIKDLLANQYWTKLKAASGFENVA